MQNYEKIKKSAKETCNPLDGIESNKQKKNYQIIFSIEDIIDFF